LHLLRKERFMTENRKDVSQPSDDVRAPDYEAPEIEAVVTPEGLEREVQYSGGISVLKV